MRSNARTIYPKRRLKMNVQDDYEALLNGWLKGQPCSPLHGKTSKASIKRILDLHDLLREVLAEIDKLPWHNRMEKRLPRLEALENKLNERLALYAATPTFRRLDGRSWGVDDLLGTSRMPCPGLILSRLRPCWAIREFRWYSGTITHTAAPASGDGAARAVHGRAEDGSRRADKPGGQPACPVIRSR
jgi:hypothetical protein